MNSLVGLAVAIAVSLYQGALTAKLGVPSFVVTLGGLMSFRGAAFLVADGKTQPVNDQFFQRLGGGFDGAIGVTASWVLAAVIVLALVAQMWAKRRAKASYDVPNNPLWLDAAIVLVPMLAITQLGQVAMGWVLLVSTLFFVCMSGRMIPGMAMLTSAANPALRGTFMTLNSAVQSGAMGLAALVGGYIIDRDATGLVENYGWAAVVGGGASVLTIVVGARLRLHPSAKPGPG